MKVSETALPGVLLLELQAHADERGQFLEVFQARRYQEAGIDATFVQDNVSVSRPGVVRGLHFQQPHPQGKLVQVLRGRILDVAVDLRRSSPCFGRALALELSADRPAQLWVPPGFAHGFCALTDAEVLYKCTALYAPACERTVRWNDPDLAIAWPVAAPIVSAKDRAAPLLRDLTELFA